MSAAFRTSLEFFQIGVVATSCSLAAAMVVELLFPRYDASRNPALQALEGILGMTLHYMLGLELFLAAVPLTGRLYPATVFSVLTPVMVPNSLAKMSGNVRGLSEAVRPMVENPLPHVPVDPLGPVRPPPGTPEYEQMLEEIQERLAEVVLELKQGIASLPDLVTAEQMATALRQLQQDMQREMTQMYADLTRTGKAWAKHEKVLFEQRYQQRNALWEQQLKQLKQDFAVQWAALKAQWNLRPRCPGAPECDPVMPPVVPDVPTWQNPAPGVTLARGSYSYTGDPESCQKNIDGLGAEESDVFNKCGQQVIPMSTTDPATGATKALTGCVLPNIVRGVPVWGPLEDAYYPKTPECYTCTPPDPMAVNWIIDTGNGKTQKCGVLELRK